VNPGTSRENRASVALDVRAAWYETQGPARDVLVVGTMPDPEPGAGEVRIRIEASGINPGDVKKRANAFGIGMPYPRVIPHSDGAGRVDRIGPDVSRDWLGRRVWCFGAQSYRPFGTAAEYCVVSIALVVPLSDHVSAEQGACLGIPGITGHRAIDVAGPLDGSTVLVQGGAGAVGLCALQFARRAGARVIAVVRSVDDVTRATQAGAHDVVLAGSGMIDQVKAFAPNGVQHIVDVALGANVDADVELLAQGGSIAAYSSDTGRPHIPFWLLLFKNIRLFLLGSDDFPIETKRAAAQALNAALDNGWTGFEIAGRFPLDHIAMAHEQLESDSGRGRVVLTL
jgi:NADPH2:quinone reductase